MFKKCVVLLGFLAGSLAATTASAQVGHLFYKSFGPFKVNRDFLGDSFAGCSATIRSKSGQLRFQLQTSGSKSFHFKSPKRMGNTSFAKVARFPVTVILDGKQRLVFRQHSVPMMFNDEKLTRVPFDKETSAFLNTKRAIRIKQGKRTMTWKFPNGAMKNALLGVWDCVQKNN
ncbi:hypothetical protein [Rhodobium gokarnense]|uniref:Lipoprotein n=1 Tax=Rhodobium gokarnense TaxID=364296 RepID=A0ABT3HAT2_9HYPH|nr:hypothetical protein [Rhodobium gokarnense]MCW2307506.1 hypothetical protein [Rhodobium gokarnense]